MYGIQPLLIRYSPAVVPANAYSPVPLSFYAKEFHLTSRAPKTKRLPRLITTITNLTNLMSLYSDAGFVRKAALHPPVGLDIVARLFYGFPSVKQIEALDDMFSRERQFPGLPGSLRSRWIYLFFQLSIL